MHTSEVLPVSFFPSRLDPIYSPSRDVVLRHPSSLKLRGESDFFHLVFASDIDSPRFRGFLRTLVADRPFFDPSGPPEWSAEYSAVYEVCHRFYAQTLTEDGQSMLYLKEVCDKGEIADLRILKESVIGKPSMYEYHTIRIFEEVASFSETGFSPLPPPRPLVGYPTRMPHRSDCSCMKTWNADPLLVYFSVGGRRFYPRSFPSMSIYT